MDIDKYRGIWQEQLVAIKNPEQNREVIANNIFGTVISPENAEIIG